MKRRQELKRLYQTSEFDRKYHYEKRDLGALCTEEGTSFLLWSPLAKEVKLQLYHDGEQGECFEEIAMQKEAQESGRTGRINLGMAFIILIKLCMRKKSSRREILMRGHVASMGSAVWS